MENWESDKRVRPAFIQDEMASSIAGKRMCPVCGSVIAGRVDKIFCSDDCRVHYHNVRYRERHRIIDKDRYMLELCGNATFLLEKKSYALLKFIVILSGICKIISTFGAPILKGERKTEKSKD